MRSIPRTSPRLALAFAFALIVGTAGAAEPKAEDAIKYRQSVYAIMGWNTGPMAAMAKGEKPFDKEAFLRYALIIDQMAKLPMDGFVPGSEKGNTKARSEIWSNMPDFRAKQEKMQAEAGKLVEVARAGNFADVKPQFGKLASSCKACHEDYRQK